MMMAVGWLSLLDACSQRIRRRVLELFGSAEARVALGLGAGGDVMKKIDAVAEEALIETLQDHGVSCTLVSEEAGVRKIGSQPSEFYLTADPVDGTTNAVRGLPFMATSLAVSSAPYLRDVNVALVTDLFHGVTYTAERGGGALKDGKKINPSSISSLEEAVVGVDFNSFKSEKLAALFAALVGRVRHLRHLGANALEICYVADGTTDAFIDLRNRLRVTDAAAARLILKEAGGLMLTPECLEVDAPLSPTQRISFIAAANTKIYGEIAKILS
jgi:myo-inositol-1(or 4)-monophosphatase